LQILGLDMRDKLLTDNNIVAIASCVSNIEQLDLGIIDDNELKTKGIQALSEGIKNRKQQVKKLTKNMQQINLYY